MTVKTKKARFLSAILCLALALGLLAGCGSTEAKQPEMSEVVAAVEAAVPTDGMTELDANYLKNVFKLDESQYADCCVMTTNVGTTIDEFGIFKGKDSAQAAELKAAVEEYLQFRLDSWMPEYLPEEFPKLQAAQLWSQGDYVMYAILSDDAKTAAGDAFTACFAA